MAISFWQPGYLPAQTLAGVAFIGATAAAGVTIPATNATSQTFGIWNPVGSGVEIIPVFLDIGISTATTPVVAGLALSYQVGVGSQVATGGPISAFTASTPVNARLGLGVPSKIKFTASAATLAAAPSLLQQLGISFQATSAGSGFEYAHYDFSGLPTIPPGVFVGLTSTNAQSGTVTPVSLGWIEIPFNG